MGLPWQQGPLSGGTVGGFLTSEPLRNDGCSLNPCAGGCASSSPANGLPTARMSSFSASPAATPSRTSHSLTSERVPSSARVGTEANQTHAADRMLECDNRAADAKSPCVTNERARIMIRARRGISPFEGDRWPRC